MTTVNGTATLGVAYGAGLRVSKVAHLKVDDIDSERMLIRVEQGKGSRDRRDCVPEQGGGLCSHYGDLAARC